MKPIYRALALGGLLGGAACAGAEPTADGGRSLLPADYRARFVEVRGCRPSIDHDLGHIVVKVAAEARATYLDGPFPFPVGTLVVKEEWSDPACAVPTGFTLMRKEAAGYDPAAGDWRWQRLDASDRVLDDGRLRRCAGCHAATACRARDFTCAEP